MPHAAISPDKYTHEQVLDIVSFRMAKITFSFILSKVNLNSFASCSVVLLDMRAGCF